MMRRFSRNASAGGATRSGLSIDGTAAAWLGVRSRNTHSPSSSTRRSPPNWTRPTIRPRLACASSAKTSEHAPPERRAAKSRRRRSASASGVAVATHRASSSVNWDAGGARASPTPGGRTRTIMLGATISTITIAGATSSTRCIRFSLGYGRCDTASQRTAALGWLDRERHHARAAMGTSNVGSKRAGTRLMDFPGVSWLYPLHRRRDAMT